MHKTRKKCKTLTYQILLFSNYTFDFRYLPFGKVLCSFMNALCVLYILAKCLSCEKTHLNGMKGFIQKKNCMKLTKKNSHV